MALGMGKINAVVFKMVPKFVPNAVSGAAGLAGGLDAFGGFVISPIIGYFVDIYKKPGYSYGFVVFKVLCIICSIFVFIISKNKDYASA